jgi:hypothetical protein
VILSIDNYHEYSNVSIERLYDLSMAKDSLKMYEYIVALIHFLADLCRGENYQGVELLR